MDADKKKIDFLQTVKAGSILGGVHILQIFITLFRSKIIAVLLGASGMGLYALLQSVCMSISQLSSLGIHQSGVREISLVHGEKSPSKVENYVSSFAFISLLLAFIGGTICIVFSSVIAEKVLNNIGYSTYVKMLSLAVFFYVISQAKISVLQGSQQLKLLSKSSLLSTIVNLLISIPLYYYLKTKGIVLSIVLGYFISNIIYGFYLKKVFTIQIIAEFRRFRQNIRNNINLLSLGVVLMVNSLILTLSNLVLSSVINKFGALSDVGYTQASLNIIGQVLMLILSVLASSYYPKLSASINSSKAEVERIVNNQFEFALIVLLPISVALLIFAPMVIKILFTPDFLVIVDMLKFMIISIVFRCVWSLMSYVILAKGDKKTYLIFDGVICNFVFLAVNILCYLSDGLVGLGLSYLIMSVICCLILVGVVWLKYSIKIANSVGVSFMISIIFIVIAYFISLLNNNILGYCFKCLIVSFSLFYSIKMLNQRINLKALFTK